MKTNTMLAALILVGSMIGLAYAESGSYTGEVSYAESSENDQGDLTKFQERLDMKKEKMNEKLMFIEACRESENCTIDEDRLDNMTARIEEHLQKIEECESDLETCREIVKEKRDDMRKDRLRQLLEWFRQHDRGNNGETEDRNDKDNSDRDDDSGSEK